MLIERDSSYLLIVDVQEKLAPAVRNRDIAVANAARLIKAAQLLGVPVLVTEHCPDRIGHTVEPLRSMLPADAFLTKVHFAATNEPAVMEVFRSLNRRSPVVCGMEAHVCVGQTTLGLLSRGFSPFLVTDAVASRKQSDLESAVARMRHEGIRPVTTEAVIFEWLKRADTEEFRRLLPVLKEMPSSD